MAGLAVNVDHVATLRQARGTNYPDPVHAAVLAELGGADGVVVHLREDRRHINERDVQILRQTVKSKLILEMAASPEMVGIAINIQPEEVTLVPEKREELTTEGGLDLLVHSANVAETIATLKDKGMLVSIFIDPDVDQVKLAHKINADAVEVHTGVFCDAKTDSEKRIAFNRIIDAVKLASKLRMGVHAGHGICYNSIKAFRGLSEIDEFSIGHSIVGRSVLVGMEAAVREMLRLVHDL
ncbi:pyridoxine 5'-phosphate synthase [Desulfobacterales bacterium HSG17]|nr:pyridoxine 5'-phosphate synthase [Desulfobacterales bacterium HSG17]